MTATSAVQLPAVQQVVARLQAILGLARQLRPGDGITAPLPTEELLPHVAAIPDGIDVPADDVSRRFNAVEAAAREMFYALVGRLEIGDAGFVEVWNLLDVLLLCGDEGVAAPELVCWLIEELLDSQTTTGCRTVFDYLESRRDRLARKHFHKKNLVFLRSCNELLRRLSRAEDAIFCGRVFFFLFQTFPLGDKSSVNLRGEFHVENVTKFEVGAPHGGLDGDKMDVDAEPARAPTPAASTKGRGKATRAKATKKAVEEPILSSNELYPLFWRLQQDFSDPTRLFAPDHFRSFQKALTSTLAKFKKTETVPTKPAGDGPRGTKRKTGRVDADAAADTDQAVHTYNPKYLTSRDLFELELSDLAFQRHVLVQALILTDFLQSLTARAKAHPPSSAAASHPQHNKSVLYPHTLPDAAASWLADTRAALAAHLQASRDDDGKLFARMLDTVLARDRNWVRWKAAACPSIVRAPVPAASELAARAAAVAATTTARRAPPADRPPPGTMDLSFLARGRERERGLDALRCAEEAPAPPSVAALVDGIRTDELDLEMARDEAERAGLRAAAANKRWRVLRMGREEALARLDRVQAGGDLGEVFCGGEGREGGGEEEEEA